MTQADSYQAPRFRATRPTSVVRWARSAALARNYWSRLGVAVELARPDIDSLAAFATVAAADALVIPGGHPNNLLEALGASPLTDLVIDRWLGGMAVAGSSAGAMCLFEWRLKLYPPNPLRTIPGLGLLDGYVAAPHFERFRASGWGHRALSRLGGLGIIGVDERCGLVGTPGDLEVLDAGAVTVIETSGTQIYQAGVRVPVDLMAGSSLRLSTTLGEGFDRVQPLSGISRNDAGTHVA